MKRPYRYELARAERASHNWSPRRRDTSRCNTPQAVATRLRNALAREAQDAAVLAVETEAVACDAAHWIGGFRARCLREPAHDGPHAYRRMA